MCPLKESFKYGAFILNNYFVTGAWQSLFYFPKWRWFSRKSAEMMFCFSASDWYIDYIFFFKKKKVYFISRFSTKKTFSKSFKSEKKPFSRDWGTSFSSRVKRPFREASFISVYESNIASQFSKLTFKKGGFRFIWKSFH